MFQVKAGYLLAARAEDGLPLPSGQDEANSGGALQPSTRQISRHATRLAVVHRIMLQNN